MNLITWVLFGIAIGFFIHLHDGMPSKTMPFALVLGSIGGMLGGMTAVLLFGVVVDSVSFVAFITAFGVSILLLSFLRSLSKDTDGMRKEKYAR